MGKSGKLFKSLVAGVRVFKSPSKERPPKDDKDHVKKNGKDKCFGSLGKSSSRSREVVTAPVASPEAIEIKCVQVESEKLKDVLPVPVAEAFTHELHVESKVPAKIQDRENDGNAFIRLSQTAPKERTAVSDREEWAASKIQASFRCYLAQRAFRALRALVRLQALARGRIVRRQAAASLRCVNALIRVQALARGRRVRSSELGQLVQKHLQQTKQTRKKPTDGWVNSMATPQQLHAKAQVKQDAVTKRQRALVYAYAEQLNKRTQKQSSASEPVGHLDKSHWVWVWLERWTDAAPKGGSSAILVEDCVPMTKDNEKPRTNTKEGKPSESARKERRKWGEHLHSESISPLPQRDLAYEEHEEPAIVVKREEEMKHLPESGRLGTSKANVRKPISPPLATLSTPPLTPSKEGNALAVREIDLHDVQPSVSDMSPFMRPMASPNRVIDIKAATPIFVSDFEASPSPAGGINHTSEAKKISSPENASISPYQIVTSQISPSSSIFSTSNGHSVCAASEISHVGSHSPPKELKSNSLSAFSSLPEEAGLSSSQALSPMHLSKDPNTLSFSTGTYGSSSPESAQGGSLSGVQQPKEIIHATNGDIDMLAPEEAKAVHRINGDEEKHMAEETAEEMYFGRTNGDATKVLSEPEGVAIEEVDESNDDSNQGDAVSESNGRCDASVVSADARSVEVSSKNISSSGSKHEPTECISPSLPSYMATTKSSKAKARTLSSPKPKSESTKPKQESPKPKLGSPKTKVDSPTTQKIDSASKRRHSLSGLDGKVSPATQKPTFHVRASSKGNFSAMKDLSSDNISLPNGDSRRHGK